MKHQQLCHSIFKMKILNFQRILKACEINQIKIEDSFKKGSADFVPDPFRTEEKYKIQN